ncbi:MAG TPA: N-acetylglutaminylglutamine amidotransferase, partial [Solirubrobacteraceae bacterium]|nr:N-acetylglutaminylglutamine amidotransferase [Solirubrobacteraceae bacterium]
LTIVFNGCIYNHRELRAELERAGYVFFSSSDTEVIAKAYHRWGTSCVERFAGMFAFVLAERDSGRLVLARDRLGIKPLYLAEVDGALRFASTLPALLAGGGVDTALDPVALHHYFSWHAVVPAPLTVLSGVRKLAPATVAVVEPDGTRSERTYWDPPYQRREQDQDIGEGEWAEIVLDALRTAVKRRMVADVPVGVLLSGGLDSSLIVALLAESGQRNLATFSIGFDAGAGEDGDEFSYSDLIAREFGTEHQSWRVGPARVLAALDGALDAMSEPMTSHDAVAFYLLSEEVSASCTVVQSGQGADEVFAGYSWYPPLASAEGLGDDVYSAEFFDRDEQELSELLAPDFRTAEASPSRRFVAAHFARPHAETPLDRALRLDTQIMLVDDPVKRVDNMAMAWGLELRTPFLDHELIEVAAACPPSLKLAHGGKGVLKTAARNHVPDAVIDRSKGYFPVPAISHLEGEALALVRDALTSAVARDRGLYRPEHVAMLLEDPIGSRTPIGSSKLWQVGLLELWLQRHGL